MPYLKLMPTGGVDLNNIATFLQSGAVALGVGGNLIDAQAIREANWQSITNLATQYSQSRPWTACVVGRRHLVAWEIWRREVFVATRCQAVER